MAGKFTIQNLHLLNAQVSEFPKTPYFTMFNFIPSSRNLPQFRVSIRCCLSINRPHSLQLPPSSSPPPASVSVNSSSEHSFEVSYLIETFGWTPEFAVSRARFLNFETPDRPDRVVAFFKKHGFTKSQISSVVKKFPQTLHSDPDNTFLPKFSFLKSIGLSRTEIISSVTQSPILRCSLEKRIIPNFNRICKFVKSHDEAVKMVKRCPIILLDKLDEDSMKILLEVGVPEENIVASMINGFRMCWPSPDIFREVTEEVKEMGFDPRSKVFLVAIRLIRSMGKSAWEDKVQVLKKYGWSNEEIFLAFGNSPRFITYSKDKIDGVMDFLVNRMGIEATAIANFPTIFTLSLEKRILPRCLIYQTLLENGLQKRKLNIPTFWNYSEKKFVAKFIKLHENEAPELWDLYKELLDLENDLKSRFFHNNIGIICCFSFNF